MSTDAGFYSTTTIRAVAEARYAHSAHVEVTGLRPSTTYYYRFKAGKYSASGKTKTAPVKSGFPPAVNLAVLNCSGWQQGFFGVYKRIAEDADLDFVIHLGDYIYDSAPAAGGPRKFRSAAPFDLASFRNRHAEYKTDQEVKAYRLDPEWFGDLGVPTLLLSGDDSPAALRKAGEAVDETLPNSRIVVMPGQGHAAMDTGTDLFTTKVLRFLEGP